MASYKGHRDVVRALLNKGANVNVKTAGTDSTPLMIASACNYYEIVRALLDKGADVDAKTNKGFTALMMASENGHLDVVQALLENGADVYAKSNNDMTALSAASDSRVRELLLRYITPEDQMSLTRDIRVPFSEDLQQKLRTVSALLMGQGSQLQVLIPRYNQKEYGGEDAMVEARYAEFLRGRGHRDMLAWSQDCRERGILSLRIVPGQGQISPKLLDTIFDGFGRLT
jgi:hypothetical protein